MQSKKYCLHNNYAINNKYEVIMQSVRTFVDYVKNIYHLKLANPLTKRTLLIIG